MSETKQMRETRKVIAALLRMPPKPHSEMKVGREKTSKKKRPVVRLANGPKSRRKRRSMFIYSDCVIAMLEGPSQTSIQKAEGFAADVTDFSERNPVLSDRIPHAYHLHVYAL